jgi:hypothetical protein
METIDTKTGTPASSTNKETNLAISAQDTASMTQISQNADEQLQVFDKDGKEIFKGNPAQLLIFWNNKDYGDIKNIANISNENGDTLMRFGAADGRGFIDREKIPALFEQLGNELRKKTSQEETRQKLDELRAKLNPMEKTTGEKEQLLKQIKAINNQVYFSHRSHLYEDLLTVSIGVNPDTGERFEPVSDEIGLHFDSHGLSKLDQLPKLLTLLETGVDPQKTFYTAPFEVSKENAAALGAALGTAGGTAYKDGIAVVTGGFKEKLQEKGIKHVFINDVYADLVKPLAELFPKYQFHKLSEQKPVMEAEAKKFTEK